MSVDQPDGPRAVHDEGRAAVKRPIDAAAVLERANEPVHWRLLVVLSFPLLFLLAVPFWLHTTSIQRLPLPSSRIAALESSPYPTITTSILFSADDAAFPVPPPGRAVFSTKVKLEALGKEIEKGVDGIEGQKRPHERGQRSWKLVYEEDKRNPRPLRVHIQVDDRANRSFPLEAYILPASGMLSPVKPGTLVIPVHPEQVQDRNLKQHYRIAIVRSLVDLLPAKLPNIPLRALAYAPNVTLSFVLLNEDSSSGSYAGNWDIQQAIRDFIKPHLEPLAPIFNFSIESQVMYHAPLSFEPTRSALPPAATQRAIDAAATDDAVEQVAKAVVDQSRDGVWAISEDEAKMFVNSERWTLDSGSTNNPVLRFLLFLPAPKHRPMHLAGDSADAFLIPQFGSVVIVNPPGDGMFNLKLAALENPFDLFTRDLYRLLDLPALPPSIHAPLSSRPTLPASATDSSTRPVQPITPWQVDTVLRARLKENAGEAAKTLAGIVRLVDKIEEMQVGEGVQALVEGAVRRLEGLPAASRANSPLLAFMLARDAVGLANRAFFDPSMMGLLYFHKFSVYTPLFAPVGVAMLVSLLKELRAYIKRRKARTVAVPSAAGTVADTADPDSKAGATVDVPATATTTAAFAPPTEDEADEHDQLAAARRSSLRHRKVQ